MIEEEFIVPTRREKSELVLGLQNDPAKPVRIDSFDRAMAELQQLYDIAAKDQLKKDDNPISELEISAEESYRGEDEKVTDQEVAQNFISIMRR